MRTRRAPVLTLHKWLNYFAWVGVTFRCELRGHDYGVSQYISHVSPLECIEKGVPWPGPTHRIITCRNCGDYRGVRRIKK